MNAKTFADVDKEKLLCEFMLRGAKETLFDIFTVVEPEDFADPLCRGASLAMFQIVAEGKNPDPITVRDKAGGLPVFNAFNPIFIDKTTALDFAKSIKELATKRFIISNYEKTLKEIDQKNSDELLSGLVQKLLKVSTPKEEHDDASSILNELETEQKEFEERHRQGKKYIGFECGFEKIDAIIDGMRPGHLWVVGAWSSTGKSQFALNIVSHVLSQKIPVSVISLEMSKTETLARLMGIREGVSSVFIIKARTVSLEQRKKIKAAEDFFRQAPLEIHTRFSTLDQILFSIRSDAMFKHTKLFVVDYLQNIMSTGETEYQLLTSAVTKFLCLARELRVTILVVSQVSNESAMGGGAGAGFKGTGAIEATADLAIRLFRNKKTENPYAASVPIDIVIHKARHGFSGSMPGFSLTLETGKIFNSSSPQASINVGKDLDEINKDLNPDF